MTPTTIDDAANARQRRRDRWLATRRRHGTESGQAAGIETIPFGILVFVGGLLLVVNVWAAIDSRAALDAAARDYLRAYGAAPSASVGRDAGRRAAVDSLSARTAATSVVIADPPEAFGPCRPATVRLRMQVPRLRAPFIGSLGTTVVTATETELVQPYGTARDEDAFASPSPCDG